MITPHQCSPRDAPNNQSLEMSFSDELLLIFPFNNALGFLTVRNISTIKVLLLVNLTKLSPFT